MRIFWRLLLSHLLVILLAVAGMLISAELIAPTFYRDHVQRMAEMMAGMGAQDDELRTDLETGLRTTLTHALLASLPLAEAIVNGARNRNVVFSEVQSFDSIPGYGVSATVDGKHILVGNHKFMEKEGIFVESLYVQAEGLSAEGKTAIYVAADNYFLGVVAVADKVREEARQAVEQLHRLGIQTIMLTGDHQRTAGAVEKQLGIDTVIADVLPEQKAVRVKELQAQGKTVAMVGDGVNDAPALAQANVGIAIGAGTDVAVETADVVLMRSNPADVATGIELAKHVHTKIKQNLFWAAIYNVLAIPLAAGVLYPAYGVLLRPEWAALLMSASTVIVTVNALLLNRLRLIPTQ